MIAKPETKTLAMKEIRPPFYEWWDRQPAIGPRKPGPREIWNAALEWAAKKVEEAGCTCDPSEYDGSSANDLGEIEAHTTRCPIALARQIRESR